MKKSSWFAWSLLAFMAVSVTSLSSRPAHAFGAPNYMASCGMQCMNMYGTAFSPFMGQPYFPMTAGYGAYYQTGQMGMGQMRDPRMAIAQSLQWNGTQPMGLSYMPPIGMSAISNSVAAGAFGF